MGHSSEQEGHDLPKPGLARRHHFRYCLYLVDKVLSCWEDFSMRLFNIYSVVLSVVSTLLCASHNCGKVDIRLCNCDFKNKVKWALPCGFDTLGIIRQPHCFYFLLLFFSFFF